MLSCWNNQDCFGENLACIEGICSACTIDFECFPGYCNNSACNNVCEHNSECSSNSCKGGTCHDCNNHNFLYCFPNECDGEGACSTNWSFYAIFGMVCVTTLICCCILGTV